MDNNRVIELQRILKEQVPIVGSYLKENEFLLSNSQIDKGSGGFFIICRFEKGNRKINIFYRYSLGPVEYSIGENKIDHVSYMKFLQVDEKSKYPGFTDSPEESFKNLLSDIKNYCQDFICGDGDQFQEFSRKLRTDPRIFNGLK